MFIKRYFWHWLSLFVLCLTLLTPTQTDAAPPTTFAVAAPFQDYYNAHQGMRVLGYPLTALALVHSYRVEQDEIVLDQSYPMQYFEKGWIEDHRWEVKDSSWQFMYGRLTAELMERDPYGPVNATSFTYHELKQLSEPANYQLPPAGFSGGVLKVEKGVFIPYKPYLRPSPGNVVPLYFWAYINRLDLFPGGWLHDIGLPMSPAFQVDTTKFGLHRTITMQAFERAVLTYDPFNPAEWQVERGNIGSDAMRTALIEIGPVEFPAIEASSPIPLHVLARTNMDWGALPAPPQRRTQLGMLEIQNQNGKILAYQQITMLGDNDPATMAVTLYWVVQKDVPAVEGRVQHMVRPATNEVMPEAMRELLWGPPLQTNIGFRTALPTPQEVLSYPGRDMTWGPRVTLRNLKVEYGVATVDLSREFKAYGGDLQNRLPLIYQQISRTLYQFPGITQIYLTIEGQPLSFSS